MLAYAANAPRFADRRKSPKALLLIVGAHAAALGVLMTAKMDVDSSGGFTRTIVDLIKVPPPPPEIVPPPPKPDVKPQPTRTFIDRTERIIPLDRTGPLVQNPPDNPPPPGPVAGTGVKIVPQPPIHAPVRIAARFNTPEWALKPPYPLAKRNAEEEATLRLRLSIDDRGRVIAVEPLGNVDPVFLSAARKHLIAKWRYRPATEDGRPVHSSTVVTLRFELEA